MRRHSPDPIPFAALACLAAFTAGYELHKHDPELRRAGAAVRAAEAAGRAAYAATPAAAPTATPAVADRPTPAKKASADPVLYAVYRHVGGKDEAQTAVIHRQTGVLEAVEIPPALEETYAAAASNLTEGTIVPFPERGKGWKVLMRYTPGAPDRGKLREDNAMLAALTGPDEVSRRYPLHADDPASTDEYRAKVVLAGPSVVLPDMD